MQILRVRDRDMVVALRSRDKKWRIRQKFQCTRALAVPEIRTVSIGGHQAVPAARAGREQFSFRLGICHTLLD